MGRRWLLLLVPVLSVVLLWLLLREDAPRSRGGTPESPPARSEHDTEPEAPPGPPPPEPTVPVPAPTAAPAPAATMTLRVTGPRGERVEDAEVTVNVRLLSAYAATAGRARLRDDGVWEAVHDPRQVPDVPRGEPYVLVRSSRYGRVRVPLGEGHREVRLQDPGRVTIAVEGIDAVPSVRAVLARREPVDFQELIGAGVPIHLPLGPVQPDGYDLMLFTTDRSTFWLLHREPVEIHSGEQELGISVTLHGLLVRFDDAEPGAMAALAPDVRRLPSRSLLGTVGEDRVVLFPFVPAGAYRVEFADAAMAVDVPADGEVRFVPDLFNAFRIVIEDPDGYWAECGLRTGEWIVGVDGERFAPARDPGDLFGPMRRLEDVVIRLRIREPSGRERDVEVNDSRFFGKKGTPAGRLEPVFR